MTARTISAPRQPSCVVRVPVSGEKMKLEKAPTSVIAVSASRRRERNHFVATAKTEL